MAGSPDPKAGRIVDRHLTLCAPRGEGYQGQSPWLVGPSPRSCYQNGLGAKNASRAAASTALFRPTLFRARQTEKAMSDTVKYMIEESRLPKAWYNIVADLPRPPDPVLQPGTLQPVGPADLEPLFPMALIAQEVATERTIEIPEPVREIYRLWRPSPL